MDGRDLNNGPIFKLERNDTSSSNADLILPSDELSAFIQENNSSFSEKFDNKIISEILCSNHGDEQQLASGKTVWDNIETLDVEDSNYLYSTNKKIYCDGQKILVIPSGTSDTFHINENNQYLIESSPDTNSNMNNLEEFGPLNEGKYLPSDPNLNKQNLVGPSLSLQPWDGDFNFSLNLKTNKHNNNKWCYSEDLGMLFSQIHEAVPIEISIKEWLEGAFVNITPVFTEAISRLAPVPRCYNHAQNDVSGHSDHILQVENKEAIYYKSKDDRYTVDVPLGFPPPGESTVQILVKLGCWNTCVGGPCRKPFCLIFTLFSRSHEEIGRQIVHPKICSCPKRDMENTIKNAFKKDGLIIPPVIKSKNSPRKKTKTGKKLMSQNKKIKLENNEKIPHGYPPFALYEQLLVPSRFRQKIEEYANMLIATEHVQKYNPNIMVYKGLQE